MITNLYTSTANGDIIVFEKKVSFLRNPTLTYVDTTSGETIYNLFTKNFRYALDGVHFTNWVPLTQANLNILSSAITQDNKKIWLHFQYVYTLANGGGSGVALTINTASLNGISVLKAYNYQATNKTIFGKYVNDSLVYDLTINLAAKLYDPGIVPEYMDRRSEEFSLTSDTDYIDFWTSVAHFYSLFYVYVLQFTNIYYNNMLCEYLRQKNIIFCKRNSRNIS
jgi:hypothetical protein